MVLYMTHDLMLLAIVKAMFGELAENPRQNSQIFFELISEDSDYFVNVIYNGKTMKIPN